MKKYRIKTIGLGGWISWFVSLGDPIDLGGGEMAQPVRFVSNEEKAATIETREEAERILVHCLAVRPKSEIVEVE